MKSALRSPPIVAALLLQLSGWLSVCAGEPSSSAWQLAPQVQTDSQGVFLSDVIVADPAFPLPRILIAPPPALGRSLTLTRAQLDEALRKNAPDFVITNWSGADQVVVTRRLRLLEESELKDLLTDTLQRGYVRERGELELRFVRPWATVHVPDEPFDLKIIDLPAAGVTPSFITRFELRTGLELIGVWQTPLHARILREVWVAASALPRGQLLADADLSTEKRDVLTLRDALTSFPSDPTSFELAGPVAPGLPLLARSLRLRRIIQRGKIVEALIQDGSLVISVRVEALEDGVFGQMVRVRNLKTKREFRGKVKDEATIAVSL